jgi:hypothetical protein
VDDRLTIFTPRILLVHDDNGQLRLSHEELAAYDEAKRRIGDRANEAFGYHRVRRSALQVSLGLPLSLRGRVRECALVLSDAGGFLEGSPRVHLRGPSRAVRHAEKLLHALYHRLRANRLRDGRVALSGAFLTPPGRRLHHKSFHDAPQTSSEDLRLLSLFVKIQTSVFSTKNWNPPMSRCVTLSDSRFPQRSEIWLPDLLGGSNDRPRKTSIKGPGPVPVQSRSKAKLQPAGHRLVRGIATCRQGHAALRLDGVIPGYHRKLRNRRFPGTDGRRVRI